MRIFLALAPLVLLSLSACETLKDDPAPEREKISSMPHNLPQAWEGQAGLPGALGRGY